MHQQVGVRMCYGIAQLQKEAQALFEGPSACRFVQRHAGDELHHEIRQAVGAEAGVEQARDVGVVQARQGLAFQREAAQHRVAVHAALEQLDDGTTLEAAVGACRFEHVAHAAGTERSHDAPGAEALAFARGGHAQVAEHLRSGRLAEETADTRFVGMVRQQRAHLGARHLADIGSSDA